MIAVFYEEYEKAAERYLDRRKNLRTCKLQNGKREKKKVY
jgi:hypothetical protein